jgi:hypothetical protein
MNKIIEELSQKAIEKVSKLRMVDDQEEYSWKPEDYDRAFAELIVKECVKSTLSLRDTAIDNQWNLDETFHVIVDTIAEDFDMQHIFRS